MTDSVRDRLARSSEDALGKLAQRFQILHAGPSPLGIASTQGRSDDQVDEPGLAVGCRAKAPQVPRRDPELGKAAAGERDVCI